MTYISLGTIKNKINDFPIKHSLIFYQVNKPFLVLGSNKSLDIKYDYQLDYLPNTSNPKLDYSLRYKTYIDIVKKETRVFYKYDLLEFMLVSNINNNNLVDLTNKTIFNLNELKGFLNHCNNNKIKLYSKQNPFLLETNNIHLFVRLIPKNNIELSRLLFNCTKSNVYNIALRGNSKLIGSLGFIIKLEDRFKVEHSIIKYPFLTKQYINKELFDGDKSKYKIQTNLLYLPNNKKLNKYKLEVLYNF